MQQAIRPVVQLALNIVSLLCVSFGAASQAEKSGLPLPGEVVDVTCSADSNQSYALYLPLSYTVEKHWPMIYFFDPRGQNRRPIEMYKDIAEKYGFIIAGSNNSRNFGSNPSQAVNSIWQDTHARLSLDE